MIKNPFSRDKSPVLSAIHGRRSIRKFSDTPISERDIADILQCGIRAPSPKNRQPWRYVVVQGNAKREMLEAFRRGLARERDGDALLPHSREHLASAEHTARVMEEAPVIVLVINSQGESLLSELSPEERIFELCNVQSIGASVQNICLAATEKGIGSLWICDVYFAYPELQKWLNTEGELAAAVALGYPREFPGERPRKGMEDVVERRR